MSPIGDNRFYVILPISEVRTKCHCPAKNKRRNNHFLAQTLQLLFCNLFCAQCSLFAGQPTLGSLQIPDVSKSSALSEWVFPQDEAIRSKTQSLRK